MSNKTFAEQLSELEIDELPEVPEAEAQEPAQEEAQPRDEQGKFVSKGVEEGAPPAPAEKQEFDGAATLAERRKRQELEQELAALKAQMQQPREQFDPETVFTDPAAYTAHIEGKFQQALYQQQYTMSDRFARSQHGNELVDQAVQWAFDKANTDRHFNQQVYASGDPVGFAVQAFQQDQIVQTVKPEDLAAFRQWQAEKANPQPAAQLPPTLTGERNLGTRANPVDTGPRTFKEALGG